MTDSAWTPIHHEDIDTDEPGSTHDPQQEAGGDRSRTAKKPDQASAPIGLTLALSRDMIDAIWGAAEQLKRTALAIEENTAATRTLIKELRVAEVEGTV